MLEFFKSPIFIIVAVSVFAVLILFLIIFIMIYRKKRIQSKVLKLIDAFDLYNSQLITGCFDMLKRIRSLGQYSRSYEKSYFEKNKKYDDLLKKTSAAISDEVDVMKTKLEEKNYKALKNSYISYENEINEFGNSVKVLHNDLKAILKEDRDAREASLVIKEKYRTIKEFFNTNINDLKPLEKSFNIIFDKADRLFVNYDSLLDHAQFQEAKDLLPTQDKIFDTVLSVINELPTLTNLIFVVIPKKIDNLIEQVQELVEQKYVLDNLNIPKFVKGIRKTLDDQAAKLEMLDTYEVNNILNDVQDKIHDMELKLEAEKVAKQQFLKEQDTLSVSSFEIEKKYARFVNGLTNYQKTYVLDKKKVEKLLVLSNDIETIGYLKRELDSYLEVGNKQPFSVVSSRVIKMREEIAKVDETMKEYQEYLDSIKKDSDELYKNIKAYYLKLKQAQYHVKSTIGIKAVNEIYLPQIFNLFENLKSIDKLIHQTPIDVSKALLLYATFKDKCEKLFIEIKDLELKCKKAESSILYANAYRVDYSDTRLSIDRAEKAFIEGDFDRAINDALRVLDSFKGQL